MKKNTPTYWKTAMIHLISPLIIDAYHGFRRMLNVCKRLKMEVDKSLLNGYKRFVKNNSIDNQ